MVRNMDKALTMLRGLIADGMEFPDAEWKVFGKTGVEPSKLRAAYDELEMKSCPYSYNKALACLRFLEKHGRDETAKWGTLQNPMGFVACSVGGKITLEDQF
jgi:hypothetical protein